MKKNASQALNYAAKGYLTVCKNHVVLNFYGRLAKYWKRCLRNCKFKKKKKGSFFKWIKTMSLKQEEVSDNEWNSKMTETFLENRPGDSEKCKDSYDKIRTVLIDADVLPITDDNISNNWQKLLKPLLWIRKHIDDSINEINEKKEDNQKLGKCFRKFSLLPIPSLDAKYLTIDERVLNDIWMFKKCRCDIYAFNQRKSIQ